MSARRLVLLFALALSCLSLVTLGCESKSDDAGSSASNTEGEAAGAASGEDDEGTPGQAGGESGAGAQPGAGDEASAAGVVDGLGTWIDVGDGIKIAVLGSKLAQQAGGIMMKDDQRGVAIKMQMVHTGTETLPIYDRVIKIEAGGEQLGDGFASAAAAVAFKDEDLQTFPNLQKILPGQQLIGWATVSVPDASTGDMHVLVGKGNPVADLKDDQIAARIPIDGASEQPALEAPGKLEPTHQLGETLEGGATHVTVRAFGKLENPRQVEPGQVVYVADIALENATDQETNVNNAIGIALNFYVVDDAGHAHQPTTAASVMDLPPAADGDDSPMRRARLATWTQKLAAGATTEGKLAFPLPDDIVDPRLVVDSAVGYSPTRQYREAQAAPVGVWPATNGADPAQ